jgi:hypothetical protein
MKRLSLVLSVLAVVALALPARADLTKSLKKGKPDIQAIGTMAFGPEGVLFIGDPRTATIFAIGTGDTEGKAGELNLDNVTEKVASQLGVESAQLRISDLAVNPASGAAYLGVNRGRGRDTQPALIRIGSDAKVTRVDLSDIPFASIKLENA